MVQKTNDYRLIILLKCFLLVVYDFINQILNAQEKFTKTLFVTFVTSKI